MANKRTSGKAADAASKTVQDGRTAAASKSAGGSALSQAGKGGAAKSTGSSAATAASKTMRSGSTGAKSKSAAGSALSQKEANKPAAGKSSKGKK